MDEDTKEMAMLLIKDGYTGWTSELVRLYNEDQDRELRSYVGGLYLSDARKKIAKGGNNRREIMDTLGYLDIPFHIEYSKGWLDKRKKQED